LEKRRGAGTRSNVHAAESEGEGFFRIPPQKKKKKKGVVLLIEEKRAEKKHDRAKLGANRARGEATFPFGAKGGSCQEKKGILGGGEITFTIAGDRYGGHFGLPLPAGRRKNAYYQDTGQRKNNPNFG